MVIRNDPVTVKHTKWIFTDVGKVMMAFILATDFDFIAYMSKMAFFFSFFFWSFFHANGFFGIWFQWFLLFCMIYCITVTCHCNAVKQVKAHTNKYRFLHTFGFHKKCSALRERERERERQLYCNGKKIKWRCRGSNPGPFTCKANAVPLTYIAILEYRAFKKYYIHLFTVAHYFVAEQKGSQVNGWLLTW